MTEASGSLSRSAFKDPFSFGGRSTRFADTIIAFMYFGLGAEEGVTRLFAGSQNTPCHLALHGKSLWGCCGMHMSKLFEGLLRLEDSHLSSNRAI